jgi:hypothetical protein
MQPYTAYPAPANVTVAEVVKEAVSAYVQPISQARSHFLTNSTQTQFASISPYNLPGS